MLFLTYCKNVIRYANGMGWNRAFTKAEGLCYSYFFVIRGTYRLLLAKDTGSLAISPCINY